MRMARGADDAPSKRLMEQMHQDNRDIINTIKNKSELHISDGGRRITERRGNNYIHYLDKKVNW
jgi:hypothetical protein